MIAPQHVISTWIGHSMKVSEKHYLQVTDEMYALVTKKKVANSLQSRRVNAGQAMITPITTNHRKPLSIPQKRPFLLMGPAGFEPATERL